MSGERELNGKTAVVTGAASGIGFAVAQTLARRGANVVLNGRNEQKLLAAASKIDRPGQLTVVSADITSKGGADQLVEAALNRFGRVDILVNNAGIFESKAFTDYSPDELDTYLGYLRGMYLLTQQAVRQMQQQKRGAIVNIGTILTANGVNGIPSSAPIAAKGGITALTRNLSVELAADNIRINAVAPGVVPTPLYGELTGEQREALHDLQPLGRYGTPQDVADAVLYLASAEWVTGVILPVDGGVQAGGDGAFHGARSAAAV